MRSWFLGFMLFVSIALNIGTVSVAAVANVVSGLFETVTGLGSVVGIAGERLLDAKGRATTMEAELATAKTGSKKLQVELDAAKTGKQRLSVELDAAKRRGVELDTKLKATSRRNVELLNEVAILRKDRLVTYRGNKRLLKDAVSDTSGRIARRTATGATRNLAATLGEAWPVAGITVVVAATALELNDACVIMHDLHELDVAFNPEKAIGAEVQQVCGMRVPTQQELWEQVKGSPSAAWATVRETFPDVPSPDLSSFSDLFLTISAPW